MHSGSLHAAPDDTFIHAFDLTGTNGPTVVTVGGIVHHVHPGGQVSHSGNGLWRPLPLVFSRGKGGVEPPLRRDVTA